MTILDEIDVSVSIDDTETGVRMGSSVNNSGRIIVRFTNAKFAKKAFLNRSKLWKIPSTSPSYEIFINANLTLTKSKNYFSLSKT